MQTFRMAPTPAHMTDAELSGLFRMLPQQSTYRQRYECACGFHGTRELAYPPSHIPCPRCGGAAGAIGNPERLS